MSQKSKNFKIKIKIFKNANEVSSHENFNFKKNINDEKMIKLKAMKYVFFVKKLFYRIILNKSHKMKFLKTKINLTIFKFNVIIRFFFNTMSIINKFVDLYDALIQFYYKK